MQNYLFYGIFIFLFAQDKIENLLIIIEISTIVIVIIECPAGERVQLFGIECA